MDSVIDIDADQLDQPLDPTSEKNGLTSINNERLSKDEKIFDRIQKKTFEIVCKQNAEYEINRVINSVLSNIPHGKRKITENKTKNTKKIRKECKLDDSDNGRNDLDKEATVQENGLGPDSDTGELRETEKKYNKWRTEEYDTYNNVNRKSVISNIEFFEKALKLKKSVPRCRTSLTDHSDVIWSSSSYIIKHIRMCILKHEWKELSRLLRLLLNHGRRYEPYVKEIMFLTTVMSAADSESDLLQELGLCSAVEETVKPFDVWYVDDVDVSFRV